MSSLEEMSGGSSETENSTHDQGGDTDSVEEEDGEENMSQSPPPSQVPPLPAVSLTETWESNLKVNQLIVKGVFSRVLNREEMTDVLKKSSLLSKRI